ncbi:MAG: flagellar hook-basal body complex protein [Gammaproteobacteria bacterium]|jgi:flagellar hook-basal body protein
MSFYTSLTGLNAAKAELGIVSNNIANVGTVGFKKARAEFGDIFATSPLQNASGSIGQGVLLKGVAQEFSQGNVAFSQNSLDMAIQGQGFFVLKPNLTSNQSVFTRNGSFRVNNDRYVVDSSGQFVQVFPVNDDGSVVATGLSSAKSLQLPSTAGLPRASSKIDLGVNLPADADIIPQQDKYLSGAAVYRFDRNDPNTFNRSTSITVFDSLGNPSIATIYYVKVSNATVEDPSNKWQTYIYVGDREIKPALLNAKTDKGENLYIDKFGQQTTDPTDVDPTFNAGSPHPLYYLNDQTTKVDSTPARLTGGFIDRNDVGFDFGSTDNNKIVIGGSETSTMMSGTWNNAVRSSAPSNTEKYTIRLTKGTKSVTLDFTPPIGGELNAASVDSIIADEAARTGANTLRDLGISYTGKAVDGTLTFFSTDDAASPFSMLVTNTLSDTEGGFSGADFSSDSSVTFGSSNETEKGLRSSSLLKISIDDSDQVAINLPDSLRGKALSGTELAAELTKAINARFGDDRNVEVLSSTNADYDPDIAEFMLYGTFVEGTSTLGSAFPADEGLSTGGDLPNSAYSDDGKSIKESLISGIRLRLPPNANYRPNAVSESDDLVLAIQEQIDQAIGAGILKVGYDPKARTLTFKPRDNAFKIASLGVTGPLIGTEETANDVLGFPAKLALVSVGAGTTQGTFKAGELIPNGDEIQNEDQRRYGIKVDYLKDQRKFVFSSGTTGERSLITVSVGENSRAADLLGISDTFTAEIVSSAGTGLSSKPAVTTGSRAGIDISGTFSVTANDNTVNVTVDGIDGSFRVPAGAYTGATFATALESRINAIAAENGKSVGGVKVTFDSDNSRFVFTSGTTSEESFINVNGHPNFGLSSTAQTRGSVPKVTVLQQAKDADGNLLYIDKDGKETTKKPESLPNYAPIYLTKGQLTFDTAGKLISPKEGAKYTPFDPQNGADLIVLNVDYGKFSTQYSQPFSVLSLTQDGFTSGRLDGISIDSAGTVRANYTNGQQQALGKLILANFASPNGLKQIGNANYVSTSNSGEAVVGVAGSDGYGTIQGGALERANVDLTEELVSLITAQRNFQANAKAIETTTNLTSTIVNIRG